jgi:serine-type D-Ala-D-Ala carboxypeptidase/endopeptidase (penicillin-binding protein 4)
MPLRPLLVRALSAAALSVLLVAGTGSAAVAAPPWVEEVDALVEGHNVSVAVGLDGDWLYRHGARTRRPPASNQKLLFAMTLLHRTSLGTRIRTQVFATGTRTGGRLRGNLWIVGHGDPEVGKADMAALARAIRERGIRRIRGRVMGATTGFLRDWWAPGWRDYFPDVYIPLPTALTFEGNEDRRGEHVRDPERRAARSLTNRLRALGVWVSGEPGAGVPPRRRRAIASVRSDPFEQLVRRMNRRSRNFHAEVLGKWLGARAYGAPGSIAKAARTIERFAENHGARVGAHDASGLSYWNRVRPEDLVELLWFAETRPWGEELRFSLPTGGHGTLEGRLGGVKVRAKTGTLIEVSSLSGWVWLQKVGAWAGFSIMSQGISKSEAAAIEDRIVRILGNRARP